MTMVSPLKTDVHAEAMRPFGRLGVGEACPFCPEGRLESMQEGALLGIKRPKTSELLACDILRCNGCGHIALFDSAFGRDSRERTLLASESSDDLARWADEGGQGSGAASGNDD